MSRLVVLIFISMKAYSLDLRKKIVEAIDNEVGTYREVAELFGVHESFIYKLLRQRRKTGDLSPRPHGGGATLKLKPAALRHLGRLLTEQSDATLEELQHRLSQKAKVHVSVTTIWRGVQQLNITRKKRRA